MRQCGLEKNQWHLVAVYGARWPATTASFSMADTAASTQSRTTRANSTKRRANTVSTETEKKLARAARSAQRLAQLSDASRDDSTLDMFPDDPTRATVEAMNIDIRQGTLHGFELPDVVLAAVGGTTSLDAVASASSDTRAARRAPREKVEPAYASVPLDGFERIEPTQKVSEPKDESDRVVGASGSVSEKADASAPVGGSQPVLPVGPTLISPSMAAANLVRSVTARRQVAGGASSVPTDAVVQTGAAPQRFDAAFATAAAAAAPGDSAVVSGGASPEGAAAAVSAAAQVKAPAGDAVRPLVDDAVGAEGPPTAPELDRARATAFADTVDALYGVISDQRRAATDHSRRMKWMLSIVVGALLATVAIGITQTVLLMRLTRETTAQQHRIEQLMQNQQAAMTSLLDAHLAAANATAPAPSTAPASSTPAVAPRTAATAPAPASKHKAHAHVHKPKAAPTH